MYISQSSKITMNEVGKGWTQWYSSSASHLCCFLLLCLVILSLNMYFLYSHLYNKMVLQNGSQLPITSLGMWRNQIFVFLSPLLIPKENLLISLLGGQDPISGQITYGRDLAQINMQTLLQRLYTSKALQCGDGGHHEKSLKSIQYPFSPWPQTHQIDTSEEVNKYGSLLELFQ